MKFVITKEWVERMAKIEDECGGNIGAGVPDVSTWDNAKANAKTDCPKCHGTGSYMYDHNHGTICNLCCKHNMGWWRLSESQRRANGGNELCCRAGCGHTIPNTYEIIEDGKAIRCLVCDKTSWSAGDIENLYCGNCKMFHEEKERCGFCGCMISSPCESPPPDYCERAMNEPK